MKNLKDYMDGLLVVTKGRDGGDSCAHGMAMLYAQEVLKPKLGLELTTLQLISLEASPGRFVRNPDKMKWYSNPDTFTRDQMTPLLAFLGLTKLKGPLSRLFKAHAKRGFLFAWNKKRNHVYEKLEDHLAYSTPDVKWDFSDKTPDPTGPEIWTMWIRAFRCYPLYPLLLLFDLQNLGSSIKHRYKGKNGTDIQMNHIIKTDFSTRIMPTPISLLSRRIYGTEIAKWALDNKWGKLEDEPPVNQFLIPLVESWEK